MDKNQISTISLHEHQSESTFTDDESQQWIQTELSSLDIGDCRLNQRCISILNSFWATPNASIPQATISWKNTKGAYRFLNNKKATPEKILTPHQQTTSNRISQEKIVLAIQDTTTLNYTHHSQVTGLGNIGTNPELRGMLVHTTLSITPERVPLGIIHQQTWIRPPEEYGKKDQRHKKPIEEKESQKWLTSLQATEQLQKDFPDILFINIGDRESDIYELFHKATLCQCKLLVRAAWDRKVESEKNYLWNHLEAQPLETTLEVNTPCKSKKSERIAHLELRFAKVTIKPPYRMPTLLPLPSLSLFAIYVNEPSPPQGEEPLSWMLLTTLEVNSVEDALQYVEYYALRFTIELFHKVLKSGCNIEKHQLKTADGLKCCLAMDSIIAWRIMFLTMLGRSVPNLPCTVIFQNYEWKALYCFVHNTQQPPIEPPSLQGAIKLIASLGGFLGRKRDGDPGIQSMWRGLQKLSVISVAWKAFGPNAS